jgi:hypothetical protein
MYLSIVQNRTKHMEKRDFKTTNEIFLYGYIPLWCNNSIL